MGSDTSALQLPAPIRDNVVLLTAAGSLGWVVANRLARRYPNLVVIAEKPEAKSAIIRRRARLLGWPTALGQAVCGVLLRLNERLSAARREAICNRYGLQPTQAPGLAVHRVASVNAPDSLDLLRQLQPRAVAVYGTRILKKDTLAAVDAPFINYHAGINPKYRGQHPAYWALANDDRHHAGVTVHLVDPGIDTGDVLYQAPIVFDPTDTIATYQWVQMPTGVTLLEHALDDALAGRLNPRRVDLPSALHFPPTLWSYLWTGLSRRVW